eukprot:4363839-Amphidinium_carterae.1
MMNLFLTPPFIELTIVQLLLKFVLLLDGPGIHGMMRSSLLTKAMPACLMVFGTSPVLFGEIYVTPLWISSMRTPTIGLVPS